MFGSKYKANNLKTYASYCVYCVSFFHHIMHIDSTVSMCFSYCVLLCSSFSFHHIRHIGHIRRHIRNPIVSIVFFLLCSTVFFLFFHHIRHIGHIRTHIRIYCVLCVSFFILNLYTVLLISARVPMITS